MYPHFVDRLADLGAGLRDSRMLPWRSVRHGGPVNTLLLRPLRRISLRALAVRELGSGPLDLTVVIGSRDRAGNSLRRALESIVGQRYEAGQIRVVLVDYGSESSARGELARLGRRYGARVLRADSAHEWNRSRCLNLAVRGCRTPLLLCSDVDVLLPDNYVAAAVARLRTDPLQVLYPRILDLPADAAALLHRLGGRPDEDGWNALRSQASLRFGDRLALGFPLTFTRFIQRIRGFDEAYRLWGVEDDDLARRLRDLGLAIRHLGPRHDVLHQFHPKHAGVADHPGFRSVVEQNRRRYATLHTLVRNDESWGREPDVEEVTAPPPSVRETFAS
jgi:hypothetical protein